MDPKSLHTIVTPWRVVARALSVQGTKDKRVLTCQVDGEDDYHSGYARIPYEPSLIAALHQNNHRLVLRTREISQHGNISPDLHVRRTR
jgi:hypothetical protein